MAWHGMLARCANPRHKSYASYGGRGIAVCERWQQFSNFFADMGERPVGHSLDRINNEGPYSPDNCRWAPRTVQMRNTRSNRFLTLDGVTKTLAEWGVHTGIATETIWDRLNNGWSVSDALTRQPKSRQ